MDFLFKCPCGLIYGDYKSFKDHTAKLFPPTRCEWCDFPAAAEVVGIDKGNRHTRYSCPDHIDKSERLVRLDGFDEVEISVLPSSLSSRDKSVDDAWERNR